MKRSVSHTGLTVSSDISITSREFSKGLTRNEIAAIEWADETDNIIVAADGEAITGPTALNPEDVITCQAFYR